VGWFFAFFFISGFCSILYELVWLRLSMAQFGVTTALVSIVLSMFMAGLGLGSWVSGRLLRRYPLDRVSALRAYALTELLIGISALLVPQELSLGRQLLQHLELSSSFAYYFASGIWLALTLVPWCACMGATIPIGMQAIRRQFQDESPRAFSYLYLANVLGAVVGATVPLLLIEAYGFHGTLRSGALLNGLLAFSAMLLSLRHPTAQQTIASRTTPLPVALPHNAADSGKLLALLFTTGLTSMGMEVVWIREFTPYLTTVVYAFASILGVYLLSTFLGSRFYRRWSQTHTEEHGMVWILLGVLALLPLVTASPKIHLSKAVRLSLGVAPFSAVLGFVTPMLVDRWSRGDPDRAGRAYAVNVAGCILGPLISGFLLLPLLSERWVLFVLALPWLALGLNPAWLPATSGASPVNSRRNLYLVGALTALLLVFGHDFASRFHHGQVLRDNTATIIAVGEGMNKQLLVNGVGITVLTPVTKMMAHLPLASLPHPPGNALVICFGMGTTFRSLLSWNISTTAVELVPSVPRLFWYFHPDAPELLRSPLAHVVIDDGRRFLERTDEQFDVITIDPPPPVEAAGSSLLYSKEFYATLKPRLRNGGILQQWLPSGDAVDRAAVARALKESFPYVRVFYVNVHWGTHFIASMQPLPNWTAEELAQHMPAPAAKDLVEWGPQPDPQGRFAALLKNEISVDQMIAEAPDAPALQDDRPVNEYYLIRRDIVPALKRYF
jgi:predicted membrane-bound spermidine synthase